MLLDVAVCLPKEAQTVSMIRSVVRHALGTFGVAEECIEDICLALSEACNNVVDHSVPDDEYEVRLKVDDVRCSISVTNTGDGFDAESLIDVMPNPGSPRGRGVAIMHAVMDQVAFSSQREAGTIVHLVKRLDAEPDGPLDRLRQKTLRL